MLRIVALSAFCLFLPVVSMGSALALERMDERVAPCAACHGDQGRSAQEGYYPSIAGKPAGYLYNQMRHFRDGQRPHQVMADMFRVVSDAYLLEMAQYYAAQTPRQAQSTTPLSEHLSAQAQSLIEQGDMSRDIPACTSCHGENLHGALPAIPGLTGLDAEYIAAQLGAWRAGVRSAGAVDCMREVAQRMSTQQISLAAQWLSALPSSTQDQPMPTGNQELPLRCFTQQPVKPVPAAQQVEQSSEPAKRGEYLVRAGNCAGCHASRDGQPLTGGVAVRTPFGDVYSSNLTPDEQTGIGGWTADDFWSALHHGVSPDGRLLYPAFPYTHYSLITRADSDAMLAYLQQQPAIRRPATPHRLSFPFNTQLALWVWRKLFFTPQNFQVDADQNHSWNRGRYLVEGLGHCSACHGDRNALGALRPSRTFAGSLLPDQAWYAPPLWPSQNAADRADLINVLKHGVSPSRVASGPMAEVVASSLQYLSETDIAAMVEYIDSRSPTRSTPVDTLAVTPQLRKQQMLSGQTLYEDHCASCHGDHGEGEARVFPPLKGNALVLTAAPGNAIRTLKFGGYAPSTQTNPYPFGMPPYAHQLRDDEIAAVLTYIRNAWGNQASAVSPVEVAR